MKRHALFVGVNDYTDNAFKKLRYSLSDAVALSGAFAARGFDVEILSNPKADTVLGAVERKASDLGPGDVFLFFFAGHGFTAPDGSHLLICSDDRLAYLRHNRAGIPVDLLEEITNGRGCNRAFLLDACRTDVFAGVENRGAETRDLALVSLPDAKVHAGTCCVLRSCDRFCPAMEFEDLGHGVFTRAVMDVLGDDSFCTTPFGETFVAGIRSRMQVILSAHSGAGRQNPCFQTNGEAFCLFDVMASNRETPPSIATVAPSLVKCPICGRWRNKTETFDCRECGRENICIDHQDPKTFLCADCAAKKAPEEVTQSTAAHMNCAASLEATYETVRETEGDRLKTIATRRTCAGHKKATFVRLVKDDLLLGRYEVLAELGQGGMGIVYKCFDRSAGVDVAVKCLPPEVSHDKSYMEDIRDNFQLVSDLRHPGIVSIRNLETDPTTGDYYLVMDLAPGKSLRRWARAHQGLEHLQAKLNVISEIAEALDYAHRRRIMHRDIKPENVMMDEDGHAHVLDFGLASQIPGSTSRVGLVVRSQSGTPWYKAPEQWRGQPQNAATDQYSLGVLAYELISGYLPFDADDISILRMCVLNEKVARIGGVPAHINNALERALSKDPQDRFASCTEFVEALLNRQIGRMVKRKTMQLSRDFVISHSANQGGDNKSCVVLQDYGSNKIAVVAKLRELFGWGLAKAKDVVDAAPVAIVSNVSKSEAERIGRQMQMPGVSIVVRYEGRGLSLGESLRAARLAEGYSIEQVAAKTRMLPKIVQELENDDFHSITAPIYGCGFVRLYAECVGLDPEPLTRMFMEAFGVK